MPGGDASTLADKLNHLFAAVPPRRGGRREFSNEHVAAEIGRASGVTISQSYIWQLRKGRKDNPTLKHLQALADFFGVPAAYFFDSEVTARVNDQLRPGGRAHSSGDQRSPRSSDVDDDAGGRAMPRAPPGGRSWSTLSRCPRPSPRSVPAQNWSAGEQARLDHKPRPPAGFADGDAGAAVFRASREGHGAIERGVRPRAGRAGSRLKRVIARPDRA